MRRSVILISTVMALGGCTHMDNLPKLSAISKVPESQIAALAPVNWQAEFESKTDFAEPSWVRSFGDDKLLALVDEALANNHSLAISLARMEQSTALARISNAARLPSVSLGASGTGNFIPNAPDTDSYGGSLSAAWELDLWGKIRDRAKAGYRDAEAAQADFEALRLAIAGQTANAWFDLIAASQQELLAEDDVNTRERSMGIVERRYKRGLSTSLDVRLARSALAGSRASLAFQKQQHSNAARRLEVLLGRYPGQEIVAAKSLPSLGTISRIGAPSALLTRRPDIRAAEARLKAAGFRVSDARKAMLPSVSLSGSASTGGGSFGDIFDVDGAIGQLIGSLSQPVFRGGAIKADIARNEAAQRERLASYAQTVLVAWREAEDALAGDQFLNEREAALAISASEALEAQTLAEREYSRGVGTIFELLDAQRRRISAQSQLITANSARASNRVSLYLALGGDTEQQAVQTAQYNDEEPKT